jgi:hypothetical protein
MLTVEATYEANCAERDISQDSLFMVVAAVEAIALRNVFEPAFERFGLARY